MRTRALLPLIPVLLAFLAPTPAAADAELDKAAAAKGRITYVRYCVSCHGQAGKGDGSIAGDLRVPVPDLTTLAQRSQGQYPYARVVKIVELGETLRGHGTQDMPAWGDAFKRTKGTGTRTVKDAIRNVTHYIWSIQQGPAK